MHMLTYKHIDIMVRVLANGPGVLGSIPDRFIQKTQKWYLMPPYLAFSFSIVLYRSRLRGAIQGKNLRPLQHLDVVTIEISHP